MPAPRPTATRFCSLPARLRPTIHTGRSFTPSPPRGALLNASPYSRAAKRLCPRGTRLPMCAVREPGIARVIAARLTTTFGSAMPTVQITASSLALTARTTFRSGRPTAQPFTGSVNAWGRPPTSCVKSRSRLAGPGAALIAFGPFGADAILAMLSRMPGDATPHAVTHHHADAVRCAAKRQRPMARIRVRRRSLSSRHQVGHRGRKLLIEVNADDKTNPEKVTTFTSGARNTRCRLMRNTSRSSSMARSSSWPVPAGRPNG